jgi:hypothetical protein
MMKLFLLLLAFSSTNAAPAVVWNSIETVHSSDDLPASELFGNIKESAVVFLLARSADGSETLSKLASQGSLPKVAAKYDTATTYHHVSGVLSAESIVRDIGGEDALEVTLEEFAAKLEGNEEDIISGSSKKAKRARALKSANMLVVNVDAETDPAVIDQAVVTAVEHSSFNHVILTAARSVDEVKYERQMSNRRRLEAMKKAGQRFLSSIASSPRRRLEENAQQQNGQQNNNDDSEYVYYVSMTPNILAGILFTFMFAFVTSLAVTCMGMIKGQDVYVSKMPTIGRES